MLAFGLTLALTAQDVRAEETMLSEPFHVSGFGSTGAVHSNNRLADFTSSVPKTQGAGYSDRISAGVDSRLGMQLDVAVSRQWDAVIQVIAEQHADHTYRPAIEWANIQYQITPDLALRAGRIALPLFWAAAYRKVGFAYPWVRTPCEVYGSVPISNSDGVDVTYRWRHNAVKSVTQLFYGGSAAPTAFNAHIAAHNLAGLSNTLEYGALSTHISLVTTQLSVDAARPLFDAFRQFGMPGAQIADQYDPDRKRNNGISVGLNFDPGNWFAISELGRLNTRSFAGSKNVFYASIGYRSGTLTPYFVYATTRTAGNTSDSGLNLSALPAQSVPAAALLNSNLNTLLRTISAQTTLTTGVRWDVIRNVALKLQFDRVLPQNGSFGMLTNVQPGFHPGQPVNVISAILDFVF